MRIESDIAIDASPERVWSILTAFGAYSMWNPFIEKAEGIAKEGERLHLRIRMPGKKAMAFRPRVLAAKPNVELRWLGHVAMPGLLDGEHGFQLAAEGEGTRFVQEERFSGFLLPLFRKYVGAGTKAGFEAMNRALKERAERNGPT